MSLGYPPGPTDVPPNLTVPSAAYKRHAWLAMLGLTTFIAVYFALSAWFAWTAWRLLGGMFGAGMATSSCGASSPACVPAFLAVFMLKALFFIQHRYDIDDIEITRAEQPELFEFIDRLADEARAPRAHKVYLSPRVNAAVFYDLSLLNLIIPSKKNLEIGLGLVNVRDARRAQGGAGARVRPFRAAIDGRGPLGVHRAADRRSRGRATRRARQAAAQLSRFDLRVAWIGWLLSIIVWSIRSMMEVLFRLVLLARARAVAPDGVPGRPGGGVADRQRRADPRAAQARRRRRRLGQDAVVRECGSRQQARASRTCSRCRTRIIERMREILNQPTYGSRAAPARGPRANRTAYSSPSSRSRRACGRRIRRAPIASRTPSGATSRRRSMNAVPGTCSRIRRNSRSACRRMYCAMPTIEPTPMTETLEHLDKHYGRAFLDRALSRHLPEPLAGAPRARRAGAVRSPARPARKCRAIARFALPESRSHRTSSAQRKAGTETCARGACVTRWRRRRAAPSGTTARSCDARDLPRVIAVLEREIAGVRDRHRRARQTLPQRAPRRAAHRCRRAGPNTCRACSRRCTTPTIPMRTCAMPRATSSTSTTS